MPDTATCTCPVCGQVVTLATGAIPVHLIDGRLCAASGQMPDVADRSMN